MKILNTILDPKNRTLVLGILVGLFMCLWLSECRSHNADLAKAKLEQEINAQNDSALTSKMEDVKNKAGEMEATKQSFVTTLAGLKKLDDSLYLESKKEIGDLRAIIKATGTVSTSPVTISNSLVKEADGETYDLMFSKDKLDTTLQWSIAGVSKFKLINNVISPGTTEITKNKMTINLVLGFTESKNDYKVFARSTSPDVTFNTLNGGLIIPKPNDIICPPQKPQKRWGIGPFVGLGIGGPSLTPSVYLGIGVNYSIINF